MSDNVTMQDLIRHFEERLQQIDRTGFGRGGGEAPHFPLLVVFLGQDAMKGYPAIASHLFRIWPQYRDELQFLGVQREEAGGDIAYCRPEEADGVCVPADISKEEVEEMLSALFGAGNHFADKSKLCVYYVLDTTGFRTHEEFAAWSAAIRKVKEDMGVPELDMLDMLVLQLNENFSRQKIARCVRNDLSAFYTAPDGRFCQSVFLLSNRRQDNTILEDWEICYRIISDVIALSNNRDTRITKAFFEAQVFTVSYAHKEKPSHDIGQVIVEHLVNELETLIERLGNGRTGAKNLLADGTLPARLGLTAEGTVKFLDDYVKDTLVPRLPTPEQLEYFPRKSCGGDRPMSELTAQEFNDLTMNAWDVYLMQTAKKMRTGGWTDTYEALIRKNFFIDEIIFLGNHLDDVKRFLESRPREPSQGRTVLEAAAAKWRITLSKDPELIKSLVDTVRTLSEEARRFVKERSNLLRSRQNLFPVADRSIQTVYAFKTQAYCAEHEQELEDELKKIQDITGLTRFLENVIDKIIDDDRIFSDPFESELQSRLTAANNLNDANKFIRQELTVDGACKYLQMKFPPAQPVLSAILLKVGTPLYQNFCNNLDPATHYYNTGSSNMAEAIVVYQVDRMDLV